MKTQPRLLCAGLVLAGLAFGSGAAEPSGRITLWDLVGPPNGGHGSFSQTEFDPKLPGREPSGGASSCERQLYPGDPPPPVKSIWRSRRVNVSADTGQVLATFDYTMESGGYPLPTPGTGVLYYLENGLTYLPEGIFPRCSDFPFSRRLGLGVANAGKTRVLVISEALIGSYQPYPFTPCTTPSTPSICPPNPPPPFPGTRTNISNYYLWVFDVATGALLWQKNWSAAGGWVPSPGRSVVADALGKDNGNEVRVVLNRFVPGVPAVVEFRAIYYDLLTGGEIQTTNYSVQVP